MKVKIRKKILKEEGEVLDLTIRQKLNKISTLSDKIEELESVLSQLQLKMREKATESEALDTWPELLDACSHIQNSSSGKRTSE